MVDGGLVRGRCNMLALVVELSPVEARVFGSLAEKQLTTPQQYPLTLNALGPRVQPVLEP